MIGLSGVTPIWSASHFCTLASAGFPPSGPSISCSLLRSVIPVIPSVAFLSRESMADSFFSGAAGLLLFPFPAWRPDSKSSSRFFFFDLSSVGASVS